MPLGGTLNPKKNVLFVGRGKRGFQEKKEKRETPRTGWVGGEKERRVQVAGKRRKAKEISDNVRMRKQRREGEKYIGKKKNGSGRKKNVHHHQKRVQKKKKGEPQKRTSGSEKKKEVLSRVGGTWTGGKKQQGEKRKKKPTPSIQQKSVYSGKKGKRGEIHPNFFN